VRLFELQSTQFDPLLIEFWEQTPPHILKQYFIQNNCGYASAEFIRFLESKGINNAETISTGRIRNGQWQDGWIQCDKPDLHYDALTQSNIADMQVQGLKPRSREDRIQYINSTPELFKEFCMIPHSWVELKGKILDPSGFYINGRSGQFDKFITDKSNLASRYRIY
jgi:hypothetical protein